MTNLISIRVKSNHLLTSPTFIASTIIGAVVLMALTGGLGFLIGLAVALVTFWAVRWDWSYFGISRPNWGRTLWHALGYTLLIIFLVDILLTPVVEHYTNTPHDLSGLDFIKGDFLNLLLFTLFMWVVAAFGEELFYRGYMMKRLAALFGNSNDAWISGAVLSSIAFGVVHFYQGISGVITTGAVGFILAMAFYRNRNNLVICMLTHGIYDMFGLSMIYFDKETVITEWAHQFLFSIIY
jgi:membrane protease YdiL (CAAX protease family)